MLNNALKYIDPSGHTSACAGPNPDPECATVKRIIKLPGWKDWFGELQPDDEGCFPTATAAGLSTLMGGKVSAAQLDIAMERTAYKFKKFGVMPEYQDDAINTLADEGLGDFSAMTTQGTDADLINNLEKGLPTIVSVSWGNSPVVGHALLVTEYNQKTEQFSFFDPAYDDVITEVQFERRYRISFDDAWTNQPNIFIPVRSLVTIIPQ